ncbi:hypothetical protein R1flu_007852 [Riccia fluitans]|uniref:Uncharacterized protein n=1 Tax=Riccia fluitans TaxID=41844 RepID=A0ABD1Z090_9MARC
MAQSSSSILMQFQDTLTQLSEFQVYIHDNTTRMLHQLGEGIQPLAVVSYLRAAMELPRRLTVDLIEETEKLRQDVSILEQEFLELEREYMELKEEKEQLDVLADTTEIGIIEFGSLSTTTLEAWP